MTDFADAYCRILDDTEQPHSAQTNAGMVRLARALLGQEEQGLSCQACDESLPVFVDDEVAGLDVARRYSNVKHHLDVCPGCAAAYVQLLQLAWLMDNGQIAVVASLSPLKLNFLPELTGGDANND
ncbi:MAG: hypothetical protein QHJ81_11985 [Anaerolineae bacterium]|nr:hypothetical protein [Anaerolineae bacterium]